MKVTVGKIKKRKIILLNFVILLFVYMINKKMLKSEFIK